MEQESETTYIKVFPKHIPDILYVSVTAKGSKNMEPKIEAKASETPPTEEIIKKAIDDYIQSKKGNRRRNTIKYAVYTSIALSLFGLYTFFVWAMTAASCPTFRP